MRFPMGIAPSQCNFLYSVVVCIASFNPNRPLGFLMILRVICNKLGIKYEQQRNIPYFYYIYSSAVARRTAVRRRRPSVHRSMNVRTSLDGGRIYIGAYKNIIPISH